MTSAGGALAPLNIKLMKQGARHKAWVLAVDQRADAAGRYFADAFATVPPGGDAGYADAVLKLVETHGIELVLPWSDEEALALAASRERLAAKGVTLACVPLETLKLMTDKAATYRALAEAGLAMPEWVVVETEEALAAAVDRFEALGDFVVKPVRARGNRGTVVVRRDAKGAAPHAGSREWHADPASFRRELLAEVGRNLPAVVMERLYAPAYDIDVLAWKGELLRAMPRRRLNPAGVPFTGSVLTPRDDLMTLARQVTALLDVSWLYDYDLMTDRAGRPVVIEINPRPSGSIAASILAGVPFYDDLF
ncbi:MAG: ATP-grasp domain-containing protein, partial [Candidatus Eiseniibacteriota bacterium]